MKTLMLLLLLTTCPAIGVAQGNPFIPASAAAAPVSVCSGTGLAAEYWDRPAHNNVTADTVIASNSPDVTFQVTSLDYPNGSTDNNFLGSTVAQLLGSDAFTGSHASDSIQGFVFRFTGLLRVRSLDDEVPGGPIDLSFAFGSDDGSRMRVAGIDVVDNDGDHAFTFTSGGASFEAPGLYPLEIIYYNNTFGGGLEAYGNIPGGPNSGAPPGLLCILPTEALYPSSPAASIQIVGVSCGASLTGTPPHLGGTMLVTLSSSHPCKPGVLLMSATNATPQLIPCRASTAMWYLDTSATSFVAGFITNQSGSAGISVVIPNTPALCGAEFMLQARVNSGMTIAQPVGGWVSNAILATVGEF